MAITALSLVTEVLILNTRAKEGSETQCLKPLLFTFNCGIQYGGLHYFNVVILVLTKTIWSTSAYQ